MKKSILGAVIAATAFSPVLFADTSDLVASSRATVKAFASQLKGELVSSMQADGPVHAIEVCNVKSPEITKNVSSEKGMEIARTSLKLRNIDNAPDDWERAVLEAFEQRKAAGEDVMKMEFSEVVETEGGKTFRYMKAIPTGAPCLVCHGEGIGEPLTTKLDSLYPQDKARGFKLGDIRGAFTVRQAVD